MAIYQIAGNAQVLTKIGVPDGGKGGLGSTGRNSKSLGGKALRRNQRRYFCEFTTAKEKRHETYNF